MSESVLSIETTTIKHMDPSKSNHQLIVNNLSISYTDAGSKNAMAIIFIHGFPFNRSMWASQLEVLKDDFRVISYDVRGHGDSDIGSTEFSISLFAGDLIHLMDTLHIATAVVCGLSMGGYIALRAIELHPNRFLGLVLSDTQCAADTPEGKENRIKAIDGINQNGVEPYADASIINLFASESFKTRQEEVVTIRSIIEKTSKETLCKTLMALANRNETCSSLSEINVPVLILVGKDDKITPIASAKFMHQKIKGSVMSIIDDAGHLANLENPFAFNSQLSQFLSDRFSKAHL
jgi:3-oxoadipate enol-lactonase